MGQTLPYLGYRSAIQSYICVSSSVSLIQTIGSLFPTAAAAVRERWGGWKKKKRQGLQLTKRKVGGTLGLGRADTATALCTSTYLVASLSLDKNMHIRKAELPRQYFLL